MSKILFIPLFFRWLAYHQCRLLVQYPIELDEYKDKKNAATHIWAILPTLMISELRWYTQNCSLPTSTLNIIKAKKTHLRNLMGLKQEMRQILGELFLPSPPPARRLIPTPLLCFPPQEGKKCESTKWAPFQIHTPSNRYSTRIFTSWERFGRPKYFLGLQKSKIAMVQLRYYSHNFLVWKIQKSNGWIFSTEIFCYIQSSITIYCNFVRKGCACLAA